MLAQKLILGYSSRIISQVISMAAGIAVARIAGPTVLGTVAFGMSFVSMFQFIADLGIGSAHIKLVSEGRDLGACNATFLRMKLLTIGFLVAAVLGTVAVQYLIFDTPFETEEHLFVVMIWLGAVVLAQLCLIPVATFTGLTQQAKQDVPAFLQTVLVQALRLCAVLLGLGAVGLSAAQLIGVFALMLAYFYLFRDYPRGMFDRSLAREYIRIGIPIIVIGFASTMLEYLDRVMLQYFSNAQQVGYYAAGFSVTGFVKTIGFTVGLLFFPVFSAAVAKGDFDYINRTIGRFERFTFVFIMPLTVFMVIFADLIVGLLLGPRFAPTGSVMAVMLIGSFFYVLNIPYGNLITGMSRLRLGAVLYLMNLMFFVALNTVTLKIVPRGMEAFGTALVVAVSATVLGFSFRITVSRLTREVLTWRYGWHLLVITLIGLVGWYIIHSLGLDNSILSMVVCGPLFLGATYGLLVLLKLASKDDFRSVLEILNARKMYNYIQSEFPKE